MNTMTTPPIITLQPGEIYFADLRRVWLAPTPVALSGDCAAAIEASAATVQAIVAKGDPAYGINTGFVTRLTRRMTCCFIIKIHCYRCHHSHIIKNHIQCGCLCLCAPWGV